MRRWLGEETLFSLYNFGGTETTVTFMLPEGRWLKVLDSSSEEWGGHGGGAPDALDAHGTELSVGLDPWSFLLYRTADT